MGKILKAKMGFFQFAFLFSGLDGLILLWVLSLRGCRKMVLHKISVDPVHWTVLKLLQLSMQKYMPRNRPNINRQ